MPTFKEILARKGIPDPKIQPPRKHHAAWSRRSVYRRFPDPAMLGHMVMVERQSPLCTFNAPDTVGDMPQFSSPGLTAWYVTMFCKENHLREAA